MIIRQLTIEDHEHITALWEAAGLEHKPRGRDSREHMANEMTSNPEMFLGCFDGDRLVGTVIGSFDGRKGWINRLAVHPDYRRMGLGRMLVENVEKKLKKKGAFIIAILVYSDNGPSLAVFRECGYEPFEGVSYLTKRENQDI